MKSVVPLIIFCCFSFFRVTNASFSWCEGKNPELKANIQSTFILEYAPESSSDDAKVLQSHGIFLGCNNYFLTIAPWITNLPPTEYAKVKFFLPYGRATSKTTCGTPIEFYHDFQFTALVTPFSIFQFTSNPPYPIQSIELAAQDQFSLFQNPPFQYITLYTVGYMMGTYELIYQHDSITQYTPERRRSRPGGNSFAFRALAASPSRSSTRSRSSQNSPPRKLKRGQSLISKTRLTLGAGLHDDFIPGVPIFFTNNVFLGFMIDDEEVIPFYKVLPYLRPYLLRKENNLLPIPPLSSNVNVLIGNPAFLADKCVWKQKSFKKFTSNMMQKLSPRNIFDRIHRKEE